MRKPSEYSLIPPPADYGDKLRAAAQVLLDEADVFDANTAEYTDSYADGTVIRFTKPGRYVRSSWGEEYFDDEYFVGQLKYAGIKAGGEWFLTGKHVNGITWYQLLTFIGPENYHTISTFGPSTVCKGQFES